MQHVEEPLKSIPRKVIQVMWYLNTDDEKLIATHLNISEGTLGGYLNEANLELDCHSKGSAIVRAFKRKEIPKRSDIYRFRGVRPIPLGVLKRKLTRRTLRVYQAIFEIESDDECSIARYMNVSHNSVHTYLTRSYKPIGVNSKTCAIMKLLKLGSFRCRRRRSVD